MDYKDIEQLLERYWQCETSVEEEATLRDFFAKEEVPAHLLRYKNLFVYQQVQQEVGLGEDFDTRILAEVHFNLFLCQIQQPCNFLIAFTFNVPQLHDKSVE